MSDDMSGFDPIEVAAIDAKLEAAIASEDVRALADICRQMVTTISGMQKTSAILGEVVFKATDAVLKMDERICRLERRAAT